MKHILKRGYFNQYRYNIYSQSFSISSMSKMNLNESIKKSYTKQRKIIFLSHKHSDLDELEGVIGFLRKEYNVDIYIDSQDESLPKYTSASTANKIKFMIEKCDKFILLVTEGALESKWCNWELGYGDALKYKNNIAILPLEEKDHDYAKAEYLDLYPHLQFYLKDDYFYRYGNKQGFYVESENESISLENWLRR